MTKGQSARQDSAMCFNPDGKIDGWKIGSYSWVTVQDGAFGI